MRRLHIPENTKRVVRQRDGFRCVVCGRIPCQYHHIISHAQDGPDTEHNLVLLCVRCHDDVTHKRLSNDMILMYRDNLSLRDRRQNPSYEFIHRGTERIEFAGHGVKAHEGHVVHLLAFRGFRFSYRIEAGVPLFSWDFPLISGRQALVLRENAIYLRKGTWDCQMRGGRFTIRKDYGFPEIELHLKDGTLLVKDVRIYVDGVAIRATDRIIAFHDFEPLGDWQPAIFQGFLLGGHAPHESCLFADDTGPGSAAARLLFEDANMSRKSAAKWLQMSRKKFELLYCRL